MNTAIGKIVSQAGLYCLGRAKKEDIGFKPHANRLWDRVAGP